MKIIAQSNIMSRSFECIRCVSEQMKKVLRSEIQINVKIRCNKVRSIEIHFCFYLLAINNLDCFYFQHSIFHIHQKEMSWSISTQHSIFTEEGGVEIRQYKHKIFSIILQTICLLLWWRLTQLLCQMLLSHRSHTYTHTHTQRRIHLAYEISIAVG